MTTAPAWKVFEARGLVQRGDNYDGKCPSHADDRKSLSLSIGEGGKVIMRCFVGCPIVTIVEALGLKMQDLWPPGEQNRQLEQKHRLVKTYKYVDESGKTLYEVCRMEPKGFRVRRPHPSLSDTWEWSLPAATRHVLYRLPELLASGERPVVVVEGEKDADSLTELGFVVTTCNGGAQSWRKEYGDVLKSRHVIIVPDNDDPGIGFAMSVAATADHALVVMLPGLAEHGDVSDWIANGGTAGDFRRLCLEAARRRVEVCQTYIDKLSGAKK